MGRKNPEPKWQKNEYGKKNHHMKTKKKKNHHQKPTIKQANLKYPS
jgi:hypothetical protein